MVDHRVDGGIRLTQLDEILEAVSRPFCRPVCHRGLVRGARSPTDGYRGGRGGCGVTCPLRLQLQRREFLGEHPLGRRLRRFCLRPLRLWCGPTRGAQSPTGGVRDVCRRGFDPGGLPACSRRRLGESAQRDDNGLGRCANVGPLGLCSSSLMSTRVVAPGLGTTSVGRRAPLTMVGPGPPKPWGAEPHRQEWNQSYLSSLRCARSCTRRPC